MSRFEKTNLQCKKFKSQYGQPGKTMSDFTCQLDLRWQGEISAEDNTQVVSVGERLGDRLLIDITRKK